MKQKMRSRFVGIAMLMMILLVMTGCIGNDASSDKKNSKTAVSGETKKVGLILEGPISDMSWNATSYEGLKRIEKMGAEIAYQENVALSAVSDSIRTYATEGYDVIFLSSNTFNDVAKQASKDFPNVQFIQINGDETVGNFTSVQIADDEQGFLMGAISAVTSESKQVGFIGGMEITPIVNGQKGFIEGAKYVDPNIQINATLTGSFDNVNQAKETAKAMIESGADVMVPMADQASLGVIEATEESKSAKVVCTSIDQEKSAAKTGLIAVNKDTSVAYEAAYKMYLENNLPNKVVKMGVAEGVVFLSDWFQAADSLTPEKKDQVIKIYEGLKSGEIKVTLHD